MGELTMIIIQAKKFLKGDWLERAVFISTCRNQFPNMASVTIIITTLKKTQDGGYFYCLACGQKWAFQRDRDNLSNFTKTTNIESRKRLCGVIQQKKSTYCFNVSK